MVEKIGAPYGSWKSPITSTEISSKTIGLGEVRLDGDDTYWLEIRPAEAGRMVVVRLRADGQIQDATPPQYNARTLVHEYGGGSYTVKDGSIFFANYTDQRLYRQDWEGRPQPLTADGAMRYADLTVDSARDRLICVREDHSGESEAVNTLVGVNFDGAEHGQVLASGNDFYASPRISPDGRRLAWLTWNHPNMPWDGCELWVAEIDDDGSLSKLELAAGGAAESIFQPEWTPDGELLYISDRTDWWNLYRLGEGTEEPLYPMEADFGRPQWVFGQSVYAIIDADRIACSYMENGLAQLATLTLKERRIKRHDLPFTVIESLHSMGHRLVFVGGQPSKHTAVVALDLDGDETTTLYRSGHSSFDSGYLSTPLAVDFPTTGGRAAHAFYYPPCNQEYQAPDGELPPLVVSSHGGPTSAATTDLKLAIQFWTSRGFAVLDVNYGGSTGFGRRYRDRLVGQWGLVDVADCVNGARFLADQGLVDAQRMVIRGGSAGGYSTLCALAYYNVFQAGASYFGVSDLEALTKETHKFESRYLDSLVGPYPQRIDLYRERSPIYAADQISCALILFQGLEDPIVPPNQSETMLEAVRKNGHPVAYVPFEGEQHGFRRAENIKRAIDCEMYFYSRMLGFEAADDIEPIEIENL